MPKGNARRTDGRIQSKVYLGNGKYKKSGKPVQKRIRGERRRDKNHGNKKRRLRFRYRRLRRGRNILSRTRIQRALRRA